MLPPSLFRKAIIRVAIIKFITCAGQPHSSCPFEPAASTPDAVEAILTSDVLPALALLPDLAHDTDRWRRERLYVEALDDLYFAHKKTLEAVFNRCALNTRTRRAASDRDGRSHQPFSRLFSRRLFGSSRASLLAASLPRSSRVYASIY